MKTNWIFLLAVAFGLAACGNEGTGEAGEKEQAKDRMEEHDHDHDKHDHDHEGMDEAAAAGNKEALAVPEGARVFFKNLKNGDEVKSPVKVVMGVEGMEVEPAGEIKPGTGHHHILIDKGTHTRRGEVVPEDETHIHYGKGQTEDELELEPGDHVLTMQFANGVHQSYGKQMAATVRITVVE